MSIKKIIIIIAIIIGALILPSCLFINELEDYFSSWIPEKDENIAIVLDKNRVVVSDKTIDVADILNKFYNSLPNFEYKDSCKIDPILCIKNNKIYGSKSYSLNEESDYKFGIDIYSIDINTNAIEIVYSGEHFSKNTENRYEYVSRNKKTYYSKGSVVIYDGFDCTIFNIETKEVKKFSPREYQFDKSNYEIEFIGNGYKIKKDCQEINVTYEYLAKRNDNVAMLESLEKEYKYRSESPLERFWQGYYVIDQTIYFVLDVLEPDGESNALLVSYDISTDTVKFLYHYFTADLPSDNVYPIPVD